METFRYGMAVVLVVTLPPLLLFWHFVRPFIACWRRLGPVGTYTVLAGFQVCAMALLWPRRGTLVARDLGSEPALVTLGGLALLSSVWLRHRLHQNAHNCCLAGLPEVSPQRYPQPRSRRGFMPGFMPRFGTPAMFMLGLLGYGFIANYLGAYLVVLLWFIGLGGIVWLEERELRSRFAQECVEYSRRVPRFIPRFRSTAT